MHALDVQVLDRDVLAFSHRMRRELVQGVLPSVSHLFVQSRDLDTLFDAICRAFLLTRKPALLSCQPPFAPLQVFGVGQALSCGAGGYVVYSLIDSQEFDGRSRCIHGGNVCAAYRHIVLAAWHLLDRRGQDAPLHRTAHPCLDDPQLGQLHMLGIDYLDAVRAIALPSRALGLELRKAHLVWCAEEVLICLIQVAQGLLQRHGIHLGKPRRVRFLPGGNLGDVGVDVLRFARLRAFVLPHCQHLVVDPAAATEGLLQENLLLGARVYAVLEGLVHGPHAFFWFSIYCLTVSSVAPPTVETK